LKLIQSILTQNDCYKLGRKITVKGLMLHSVGCSQPSAMVFIKQWNKSGVAKCVHAFLEADGDVYQCLPWNHRGWHSASGLKGAAHNTHIGVEMCEPSTISYTSDFGIKDNNPEKTKEYVLGTYKTAVELFAMLCKEYNLNPIGDGVIISHHEGYLRGIASNHSDPEHLWNNFGLTMNQFRQDVKNAMNGDDIDRPIEKTFIKKMQVTASALNIREQPNSLATTKILGQFKLNDIVTITGQANDRWYRCIYGDNDGYIHGDFVKDYEEKDYKTECEKLKKENEELNLKINDAIKVLK